MSDPIPAHWLPDLARRGLTSYRLLGEAANVSHETVRRVMQGRNAKPETIQALADAIGVSATRVRELASTPTPDPSRTWSPPEGSEALTAEEREAISRLISLLVRGRERSGGDDRTAAPMNVESGTGEDLKDEARRDV